MNTHALKCVARLVDIMRLSKESPRPGYGRDTAGERLAWERRQELGPLISELFYPSDSAWTKQCVRKQLKDLAAHGMVTLGKSGGTNSNHVRLTADGLLVARNLVEELEKAT